MVDRKIIDTYEAYLRREMDRRQFLEKLATIAGGVAAAYALLPLLEKDIALAGFIPGDDPRLLTQNIRYTAAGGEMKAYQAVPKEAKQLPAVLVVHENRGLNPHIEDVTRRVALEGYLAMAPDALSAQGGTPADQEAAIAGIKQLDMDTTINNFVAAAAYLKTHPQSTGKVGVVGFCWGGAMANHLAVHSPDIVAAVPYYGSQPKTEDVGKIKASLLLHYAGIDDRINKGIPAYTEALKTHGVRFTMYMYDGAEHAFNNDTNPERYNREAAELAWKRTIDFFNATLKT